LNINYNKRFIAEITFALFFELPGRIYGRVVTNNPPEALNHHPDVSVVNVVLRYRSVQMKPSPGNNVVPHPPVRSPDAVIPQISSFSI
jgi:hypothetical protein